MAKFKVGDKVRFKQGGDNHYISSLSPQEVCTVISLNLDHWFTFKRPNSRQTWDGETTEFDLISTSEKTTLPSDSALRKQYPLFAGVVKYFPAALAAVSRVSEIGNQKHNPGEPLHHARGKSMDQEDCIMRHLIDLNEDFGKGKGRDENGMPQVVYIAWRALALAQIWLEQNDNAPPAPGAKDEEA